MDNLDGIIETIREKQLQGELDDKRADANLAFVEMAIPEEADPYGRSAESRAIRNIFGRENRPGLLGRKLPQGGVLRYFVETSPDGTPNDEALKFVNSEQVSQEIRRAARAELAYGGETTKPIVIEDPLDLNLPIAVDNVAEAYLEGRLTREEAENWMNALHEVSLVKVNPTHDLEVRFDEETDVPYQVIVKRSRLKDD
jgi:hypothetical protein